jgi:hypothetical protein
MNVLTMDASVVATSGVVSCDLAGDTALLHLHSGMYFTLNTVATAVWEAIQQPARVGELHGLILERYEIDAQSSADDLQRLLRELLAYDLIIVHQ